MGGRPPSVGTLFGLGSTRDQKVDISTPFHTDPAPIGSTTASSNPRDNQDRALRVSGAWMEVRANLLWGC